MAIARPQYVAQRFAVGLTAILLAGTIPGNDAFSGDTECPTIVASYRTAVTAAELDSWRAFTGVAEPEDPTREVQELVLTKTLAEIAITDGLTANPQVGIEVARERAKVFRSLVRATASGNITISEEAVNEKYLAIKDTYALPRRVRIRNLFKRVLPTADAAERAATRERVEAIRAEVLEGAEFSRLAETESDSQTRLQGGLIGNVRAGTFPPDLDTIAMALGVGEVSEVLESEDGFTLLYCEAELPAVLRTEEELRKVAHDLLHRAAFDTAWQDLEDTVRAGLEVRIDWSVLTRPSDPDRVFVRSKNRDLTVGETTYLMLGPSPSNHLADLSRQRVEDHATTFLIRDQMRRVAERQGLVSHDVEARVRWVERRVFAAAALAAQVQSRMSPPDEEALRAAYTNLREHLIRPEHFKLRVVALAQDAAHPELAHRRAAELVAAIETGTVATDTVARSWSVDPSADSGGEVGWVSRPGLSRRFGIDVARAVLRLAPGEVSGPVEDGGRVWILHLQAIEPKRIMTYEEAKPSLEQRIGKRRAQAIEADVIDEWLAQLAPTLERTSARDTCGPKAFEPVTVEHEP